MNEFLIGILKRFVDKEHIITWVSTVLVMLGAAFAGMKSEEVKSLVCAAPVLAVPAIPEVK